MFGIRGKKKCLFCADDVPAGKVTGGPPEEVSASQPVEPVSPPMAEAEPLTEPSEAAVPPEESTLPADGQEVEEPRPPARSAGGFIVKRVYSKKNTDTVQKVTWDELIALYRDIGLDQTGPPCEPLIVLSGRAEKTIKEYIGWNATTCENVREQGGLMIGKPFEVGGQPVSVVEDVIPGKSTRSDAAYLELDHGAWAEMLAIFDEKYQERDLYVVGWFHTHPNSLPVFMSGTDRSTQTSFFAQKWHFAVVLNPHRRLIGCFHSCNADKCLFYPADFAER